MIKEVSHKQKRYSQKGALHNKPRTYLPAGLIGVYPTGFQPDNHNPENEGRPVQPAVLFRQAASPVKRKKSTVLAAAATR